MHVFLNQWLKAAWQFRWNPKGKSIVTKIFDGEMFISILQTTLLQIFCKIILNFQVIFKSIKDPEGLNSRRESVHWACNILMENAKLCGERRPRPHVNGCYSSISLYSIDNLNNWAFVVVRYDPMICCVLHARVHPAEQHQPPLPPPPPPPPPLIVGAQKLKETGTSLINAKFARTCLKGLAC